MSKAPSARALYLPSRHAGADLAPSAAADALAAASCLAPRPSVQATCLQTMYDYLIKASGYVEEMKDAFKDIRTEHE